MKDDAKTATKGAYWGSLGVARAAISLKSEWQKIADRKTQK